MDISYVFDYTYILLYNLAFSSLPVIFLGILDQDVDDKVSLAVPQLYRRGIERLEWTQLKFWTYMIDGVYQSVICFYFTYLVFMPATFNTESGQTVSDYKRMGVYIGHPAVFVVNFYVLLNTYRWDWFMVLMTAISILLIWFWTGVYTAFDSSFTFYEAAPQVYGQLSYWATFLLTIVVCLAPRFAAKAFQKIYLPYDIDVVREQIRQGKFDYLHGAGPAEQSGGNADITKDEFSSSTSEASGKQVAAGGDSKKQPAAMHRGHHSQAMSEDMRPIYPPSVAPTQATTHNARSHNGSDGTDYTGHRSSLDRAFPPAYTPGSPQSAHHPPPGGAGATYGHMSGRYDTAPSSPMPPATPTMTVEDTEAPPGRSSLDPAARPSMDRPRPSFDRLRSSMDRTRPSFEASRDFTSAAYLSRVESSQSQGDSRRESLAASRSREPSRRRDVSEDLRS